MLTDPLWHWLCLFRQITAMWCKFMDNSKTAVILNRQIPHFHPSQSQWQIRNAALPKSGLQRSFCDHLEIISENITALFTRLCGRTPPSISTFLFYKLHLSFWKLIISTGFEPCLSARMCVHMPDLQDQVQSMLCVLCFCVCDLLPVIVMLL